MRLHIPIAEIKPDVGAALAADRADEARFDVRKARHPANFELQSSCDDRSYIIEQSTMIRDGAIARNLPNVLF